ncbi:hypothetical protein MMC30_007737 [Trapelia coarctata]|nr:hypothetical protein [Trapelia coarctata]
MLHPCRYHHSLKRSPLLGSRLCSRWHSSGSDLRPPLTLSPTPQEHQVPPQPFSVSLHHSSLSTFLRYAHSIDLSPTSTTYVGTYYEYLCEISLRRLGFSLIRTGGRSDAGIDLLGSWNLPGLSSPVKCIVQCKNLKAKAGPNLIRELEGAFVGAPTGWRGERVVGVLCAGKEATKGVRDAIRSARRGIVWCHVEEVEEGLGRVRQLFWNRRVSAQGAEVGLRYLPGIGEEGEVRVDTEVVLTKDGEVWESSVVDEEKV